MYSRKHLISCFEEVSHFLWSKPCENAFRLNCKNFATRPPYTRRRLLDAVNGLPPSLDLKKSNFPSTKRRENQPVIETDMDSRSYNNDVEEDLLSKVAQNLFTFRYLDCTDYGRSIVNNPSCRQELVTVVSYNVLAQTLLARHDHLYRNCDSRVLPWRSRRSRLREELRLLNADIFCLQEVEAGHFVEFFEPELSRRGYRGVYKQRTGGKIDGCAIFYRADKFTVVDLQYVELFKDEVKLLDRDNIGVILRLKGLWPGAGELVVATTHLLYNPRRSDIRLTQTQIMLAEIERVANNRCGEYCPVIFTGDMNYTPASAVYRLVTDGILGYEGKTDVQILKRRLLPPSLGVTDSCQFADSVQARDNSQFETGILSHGLNLGSAYRHVRNGLPEATTHQDEWQTVDYIFYSQKVRRGYREEGELKLVSRIGLPTSDEASLVLRELPNEACGSDHLPLCATFHLTSRSS